MGKRRNGKWLLAALLAVSLLFGGATALAAPEGTGSGTPSNVISVGGSATVTLQPDVAYVTTGVNSVNRDLAAARRDNNDRMTKVLTQLSKQGIEDKDIKTTDYSINARSTTSSNRPDSYEVNNSVQVKVRDLTKLSAVLDGVVSAGATGVYGLYFDVDDREDAYNQAVALAIADARTRAETLAKAAGRELGDVRSMAEGSTYQPYVPYATDSGLMAAAGATPISAGTTQIQATVNVEFTLR